MHSVYPDCLWKVNTEEKVLYLSFDDGPADEVTSFVLDELHKWNAKATFFCVGKNIEAYPELFQRIISEGHSVGNHTYDHLNGWNTMDELYYNNIEKCEVLVNQVSENRNQKLFRPPYGKLKRSQYKKLKSQYKIVMWDVMSFDFDPKTSGEKVFTMVKKNTSEGSIVVFHNNLKAKPKVEFVLPKLLEHFTKKGFKFDRL